eukprot:354346-Chlamydomonas_euryale.AAC.8
MAAPQHMARRDAAAGACGSCSGCSDMFRGCWAEPELGALRATAVRALTLSGWRSSLRAVQRVPSAVLGCCQSGTVGHKSRLRLLSERSSGSQEPGSVWPGAASYEAAMDRGVAPREMSAAPPSEVARRRRRPSKCASPAADAAAMRDPGVGPRACSATSSAAAGLTTIAC